MERFQVYLMACQFTENEITEMETLVENFLQETQIQQTIPIDIFEFATNLGFDVRGAEFGESLDGVILVDETLDKIEGFESNKIIAYNCFKDIFTKQFIVAHELAHYIKEKNNSKNTKIVVAARDHSNDYSKNKEEQKMDYIAASLLVPKNDLCQFLKKETDPTTSQLANRYNVPEELIERRIKEVCNYE